MVRRPFVKTVLVAAALLTAVPALAQQQGNPPPVTVSAPLRAKVVDWLENSGQFQAIDSVELRARVSGYLTEIHFTDGQMVKKGDLLFVIDPRPYEIAVASARAQVAQAEATVELTKRQLERGAELRRKDFLSASDYDTRLQQQKVALASLDVARAALRDAQLNLDYTHITAPVGGRMGARQVSVGNLITAGGSGSGTLLSTLVSLDPLYLGFDLSEADLLKFKRAVAAGQVGKAEGGRLPVDLRLMDESHWSRRGTLDFLDNQVDRASGTIHARAVVANPGRFILPGQFARVRMPASAPHMALLVPEAALITDQSDKMVMTVAADGMVVPKVVTTGPLIDGLQVIESGLKPDDRVVINGLMRARPGAKVTAQPGHIAAPKSLDGN
ncbi:efflux pump periplasmic linker BepF [mine drainage metagenome]|uniref:Efflux pump periplasmic linker BepF n=1 Tax=mine drainage metagenome TaxID=410659 RepID=A0A1J5R2N2_9ZZZZ